MNLKSINKVADATTEGERKGILSEVRDMFNSPKPGLTEIGGRWYVFSSSDSDKGNFWNEGAYVTGEGAGDLYGPGLYANWNIEQTALCKYGPFIHVFALKDDTLGRTLITDPYVYREVTGNEPSSLSVSGFSLLLALHYSFSKDGGDVEYDGDWVADFKGICDGTGRLGSDFILDQIRDKVGADGVCRFLTGMHNVTVGEFTGMDGFERTKFVMDEENYAPKGVGMDVMHDGRTKAVNGEDALSHYVIALCDRKWWFSSSIDDECLPDIFRSAELLDKYANVPAATYATDNGYLFEDNPCRSGSLLAGKNAGRWTMVYEFGFDAMVYWGSHDKYCFVTKRSNKVADFVGVLDKSRVSGKFEVHAAAKADESDSSDITTAFQEMLTGYDPTKAFWEHMCADEVGSDVKRMFLHKLIMHASPNAIRNILDVSMDGLGGFLDGLMGVNIEVAKDLRSGYMLLRSDREQILGYALEHFSSILGGPKQEKPLPGVSDASTAFNIVYRYYLEHKGETVTPNRSKWLFERLAPDAKEYPSFYKTVKGIKDPDFEAFVCRALVDGRKEATVPAALYSGIDKVVECIGESTVLPTPKNMNAGNAKAVKGVDSVNRWVTNNLRLKPFSERRKLWIARNLAPALLADMDVDGMLRIENEFIAKVCGAMYVEHPEEFGDNAERLGKIGESINAKGGFPD